MLLKQDIQPLEIDSPWKIQFWFIRKRIENAPFFVSSFEFSSPSWVAIGALEFAISFSFLVPTTLSITPSLLTPLVTPSASSCSSTSVVSLLVPFLGSNVMTLRHSYFTRDGSLPGRLKLTHGLEDSLDFFCGEKN